MPPSTGKTACSEAGPPPWAAVVVLAACLFAAASASALELDSFFPLSDFLPASELRNDSSPPWKRLWDEGRALARKGRLADAASRYAAASAAGRRRQLEWEHACVLAGLKKWRDAAAILEPLVEQNPAEVDYLAVLGLAVFEQGRFSRALDLFDRAAAIAAGDLRVLAGRALSLIALNRKKEAVPLLRRLARRAPRRSEVRMALASLAFELGRYSLARRYIVPLARDRKAPAVVLRLAARVHERLRLGRAAAAYWRRVLAAVPDDREARGRLALYYENSGRYAKAVTHLRRLLAGDPDNASLLGRICRLLVQQDRFAEALPYFERYVRLRPDGGEALRAVIDLGAAAAPDAVDLYRRILSVRPGDTGAVARLTADLLAAGDGDGALFVHEHLVRVSEGRERAAALRRMIPLLERLGRQRRLTRTLEELARLDPDDVSVSLRLAAIYLDAGDLDRAAVALGRLDGSPAAASPDFHCLRGRLEMAGGRGGAALDDFLSCLQARPWDGEVRRQGMEAAARIGLAGTLERLAAGPGGPGDAPGRVAALLAEAGRYHEAVEMYEDLLDDGGAADRADLLVAQAGVLFRAGLDPEAEARLFEAMRAGRGRAAAAMLFSESLDRDPGLAGVVLDYMARLAPAGDPEILLARARLLAARGELARARRLCLRVAGLVPSGRGPAGGIRLASDLLAADVMAGQGRLADAERMCLTLLGREDDPRVVAMLYRVYLQAGEDRAAARLLDARLEKNGDPAAVAGLARAFADTSLPAVAADLAARVLAAAPESVSMALLAARCRGESGDPAGGLAILKRSPVFSVEESLQAMAARLYAAMGDHRAAAAQATMVLLSWPERRDMQMLNLVGRAARYGRQAALEAMDDLFDPGMDRGIGAALDRAGIRPDVPEPHRSLWDIITFSRGRVPSGIEQAMDPAAIIGSIASDGRLAAAVTPWYAGYRWRRRIVNAVAGFR